MVVSARERVFAAGSRVLRFRPMTDSVVVEFIPRPNDFYTPFKWYRGNLLRWVVAAIFGAIALGLYRSHRHGPESSPDSVIIEVVIFALLAVTLLLLPYLRFRAVFKARYKDNEKLRVTFSKRSVLAEASGFRSDFEWSYFTRVQETRGLFMLYKERLAIVMVPKKYLAGRDELDRLRALIRGSFTGPCKLRLD